MEALLLLIALTAIFGVLVAPALRRRRLRRDGEGGMVTAASPTAGYGFVPVDELDVRLPGPDQQLVDALEETQHSGDWEPVARLLALTGDEWELRWQRVQSVAGAAALELADARQRQYEHAAEQERGQRRGRFGGSGGSGRTGGTADGAVPADAAGISFRKDAGPAGQPLDAATLPDARWLRAWRAERPGDPGGAQVYAQFLVWQALAEPAPDARRIILEEARGVCREAAGLSAADPTPYLTELQIARVLGDRKADFEALWSEVSRRAPHHMGAHLTALPYWSAKGNGSKAEADAFARTAAAHAPEGSLLPALPLFAVLDHLPEVNVVRGLYQSAEIETAIEAAEFAVDQVDEDHPVRPHVLHLLLCFLVRAERYGEAMDALHAVDGYVGAQPWAGEQDPAAAYAAYRALAVAGWESSGGSAMLPS